MIKYYVDKETLKILTQKQALDKYVGAKGPGVELLPADLADMKLAHLVDSGVGDVPTEVAELVEGEYRRIYRAFTDEEKEIIARRSIDRLDKSFRAHVDKNLHWSSGPMVFDKAKENKPKSKALKEWVETCYAQMANNKGIIAGGGAFTDEMLVYPEQPCEVSEALEE